MRRQRRERTMADEIYEAERKIGRARGRWAFIAVMICVPLWFIGVCWVGGHTPSEVIDILLMREQIEYKDPSDKLKTVEDDTSNTNKYDTEENVWYYDETPQQNVESEQTETVQDPQTQESVPAHNLPGITEEQIEQQENTQAVEVEEYNDEVNERSNEEYEKEWQKEHASSEVYSSSTVKEVEETSENVTEREDN